REVAAPPEGVRGDRDLESESRESRDARAQRGGAHREPRRHHPDPVACLEDGWGPHARAHEKSPPLTGPGHPEPARAGAVEVTGKPNSVPREGRRSFL